MPGPLTSSTTYFSHLLETTSGWYFGVFNLARASLVNCMFCCCSAITSEWIYEMDIADYILVSLFVADYTLASVINIWTEIASWLIHGQLEKNGKGR